MTLAQLCADYMQMFDSIASLSTKERIDLAEYIRNNFKTNSDDIPGD